MKKLFLFVLPILAMTLNSCSKGDNSHFQISSNRDLAFDARKSLTKYVNIDTNIENWDYELTYNTGETNWCEIEKTSSTLLTITCSVNENEEFGRDALVEFYINGKVYGTVYISQDIFRYTKTESQLIRAKDIVSKYNMSLEIDFASGYYENNKNFYSGVFNYTGDGLNLKFPIKMYASNYSSKDYSVNYVIISDLDDTNNDLNVSGSIYTGPNFRTIYDNLGNITEVEDSHYEGDFEISIYGYLDGTYISKKLTQN
ncbi:MAG: hypothetical protein LBM20_06170 [Rikenellaceae bacterium]|jgi:hypothetical protein|nr:hypothetical protein [Rikenellaceae bacterium]